ncbi:MAG: major capsid protein [Microviridae sp.]|nr:MAG: major capsid protein [Microviridae sp.]
MSHSSNIFEQRKVQIKNKSGFDLAHSNFLTQTCGTLTPVCVVPMLPNDSISLGFMSQVKLPPMATSFYGRVDYRLEAFFVPYRILWGGWENFVTMPTNDPYGTTTIRPKYLPNLLFSGSGSDGNFVQAIQNTFKRGSLADYLGFKGVPVTSGITKYAVNNIMPFLAYHKIYDDWYRNANIQKPVFVRSETPTKSLSSLPWNPKFSTVVGGSSPVVGSDHNKGWSDDVISGQDEILKAFGFNVTSRVSDTVLSPLFNDGSSLFTLRQRNWSKDYFTTATLYPQQNGMTGGAGVTSRVASDSTTFTISQLRQANILQKWLERNNIAGERYADQIRATFGVLPSDAMLDRPIFLGGSNFGIYTNSIAQSAGGDAGSSSNPFRGEVGSDAGQTSGFGKDSLIDKFTATEHGIIMVLGSIVPHQTYSTGSNRMFGMSTFADIPNPMFEGLGEEAVYKEELQPNMAVTNQVFGYVQQYAWMKYMNDEVHGLLVDDESLQNFCLQRSFDNKVKLDSSFIQIPTDYLDQVMSVASKASGFCCWNNMYFDIKKTSLLSQYTIPTLGEQPNTHTETVPNTGRYL